MALSKIRSESVATGVIPEAKGKNLIINGAMLVSQRATSSTGLGAANGYFTVDRMRMAIGTTSAGRFTMEQADVTNLSGFSKSVKISCTTADTSIAAGERLALNYRFEGQDLQTIKSSSSSTKGFTVSFYARANAAFNLCSEIIFGADTSKNSQANQINALTTDWQRFTMSIPAASNTQIDNVTTHDTDLMFWMHAGSTYTTGSTSTTLRPNVNANRAAGASSIFASTSNFVEITGIQLEIGDVATAFEHEEISTTLRKCKRYYEFLDTTVYPTKYSTVSLGNFFWTEQKRAQPTLTVDTNAGSQSLYPEGTSGGYIYKTSETTNPIDGLRGDAEL